MPQIAAPENPQPAVVFRGVEYRTPAGQTVLSQFDLAIAPGETFVLLGQSGSGKTTALKLINRLLQQSAGDVLVEGRSNREWDLIALRRRIGYVIQETGLFPHYTVERNVGVVPRLLGKTSAVVRSRVDEMLRLVDLDPQEFRGRYPHQLSGGQRQRVGVARALAGDPPILLMDEPFGALDPIVRRQLQGEFSRLQQRLRKTVILVTHDVAEALLLGTRIGLLERGRLAGCYRPEEFARSSDPLVREYLQAIDGGLLGGNEQ